MMTQYVAGHNPGLSLARMKDAAGFLRWIISVIQGCYQKATKNRKLENRVSSIVLNVYQKAEIEEDDYSWQSFQNHAQIDDIRTLKQEVRQQS